MKNLCLDSRVKEIIIDMSLDYCLRRCFSLSPRISITEHEDSYSYLALLTMHKRRTLMPPTRKYSKCEEKRDQLYQKFPNGEINYYRYQRGGRILIGGVLYKRKKSHFLN